MSSRTATVRTTRTTTESSQSNAQQESQPLASKDRCTFCKKFLSVVKADCRYCGMVFCMEHRHPETHSPDGCARRAQEQTRQQYQRDSAHILGVEARDRGVTHRQPGWNLEQSRQDLSQRLGQRVQALRETSGRSASSPSTSSSSSSSPSTSGSGSKKGGNKKKKKTPATHQWGAGGRRLGAAPGSDAGPGSA